MWQHYFDKIFLINLPSRKDRLKQAVEELLKHNIHFELVPAIEHENGAYGLFLTMEKLFEKVEMEGLGNILVFEDDVQFTPDFSNDRMDGTIHELKKLDWDLFYMGANVNAPLKVVPSGPHLLQCDFMISTHAVAYSRQGRFKCLQEMKTDERTYKGPIDMTWVRAIQKDHKSYITSKLLAVQRPGYSDVEKRDTDYKNVIQDRFKEHLKNVRPW